MQILSAKVEAREQNAFKKMNDIIQIMQRWGEWVRSDRKDYRRALNFPVPLLGRVQVKRGQCKTCKGTGRQWVLDKQQNKLLRECRDCRGDGDVMMKPPSAKESARCPYCKNTPGELSGRTCFHCRGSGKITQTNFAALAVPAFIRAEKTVAYDHDDLSWRVDRLVIELPKIQHAVVDQEYLRVGRWEDKCQRIEIAYGIEFGWRRYERALEEAHGKIEHGLSVRVG